MTRFQFIFTAILIFLGVGGVILFAVAKNGGSKSVPQVALWGTLPATQVIDFISKVTVENKDVLNVVYTEKNPKTFQTDLIAALARQAGPDMVILPQSLIAAELDKFYVVPFANYSARMFRDSFIQEGELYLTPTGVMGFPFSIDPLVMYWNRDIFTDAGIALPPVSWTEILALVPKLTKKDSSGSITQSAVAFGEMSNSLHAKDMIALLALQAGTPLVGWRNDGTLKSVLSDRANNDLIPAEQAVAYFTGFSNPDKASYSWNRSLPTDRSAFIGGRLAIYFGYASEIQGIRDANPNLNFDVAMVPQVDGKKMTFGSMHAFAILKSSKNIPAAYLDAVVLSNSPAQVEWANRSGLPPVRRDLLAQTPGDAYKSVFYKSALISNAWLDPNAKATSDIFTKLIQNVTSGKLLVSESVRQASLEIDSLLNKDIE